MKIIKIVKKIFSKNICLILYLLIDHLKLNVRCDSGQAWQFEVRQEYKILLSSLQLPGNAAWDHQACINWETWQRHHRIKTKIKFISQVTTTFRIMNPEAPSHCHIKQCGDSLTLSKLKKSQFNLYFQLRERLCVSVKRIGSQRLQ